MNDAHLFAAALAQTPISVVQYAELIDRGIIRKFTPYSVTINGTSYVRSESEFRVSQ